MIKNLEDRVAFFLKEFPPCRDNDSQLLAAIWNDFLGGQVKTETKTAWNLLCLLAKKELPNPVSIWRCRQKVQQHNAELRGKKWEERQAHKKTVKDEIINWENADQGGLFDEH